MIEKLAIWYLRKRKCSVLINFNIDSGYFQSLMYKTYLFDNALSNVHHLTADGKPLTIPEGKFTVIRKSDEEGAE
ncbi:hypothetical protein [Geomicrobium sp. JCM 19039]|uniref:hypothetical protein n=1 Tax=Geomicrobium sp. JCM 19039 TaxID=1460636 RepID=UPI0005A796A8|nr:hypothetical protein [Geomicrobium sp. JCM 19039]